MKCYPSQIIFCRPNCIKPTYQVPNMHDTVLSLWGTFWKQPTEYTQKIKAIFTLTCPMWLWNGKNAATVTPITMKLSFKKLPNKNFAGKLFFISDLKQQFFSKYIKYTGATYINMCFICSKKTNQNAPRK